MLQIKGKFILRGNLYVYRLPKGMQRRFKASYNIAKKRHNRGVNHLRWKSQQSIFTQLQYGVMMKKRVRRGFIIIERKLSYLYIRRLLNKYRLKINIPLIYVHFNFIIQPLNSLGHGLHNYIKFLDTMLYKFEKLEERWKILKLIKRAFEGVTFNKKTQQHEFKDLSEKVLVIMCLISYYREYNNKNNSLIAYRRHERRLGIIIFLHIAAILLCFVTFIFFYFKP